MQVGIYEQLINKIIKEKLDNLENSFFLKSKKIEKAEASIILSQYLSKVIKHALSLISSKDSIEKQIELSNKIILILKDEIDKYDFTEELIYVEANLLTAILPKIDSNINNYESYLKEITPYTGVTQSNLFTGSNSGVSLESEIKKEILSSDKIYFLVSFIRWSGLRIFEKELREFTSKGKKLKIITTSYMGATELRAIEFLSSLPNTEVKISYNVQNERLHAKSYLFFRDSGFHTGYIGSSNISRAALTSGLEWNLKVTTAEIPHIIEKFKITFETYWEDREFELFKKDNDRVKLIKALKYAKRDNNNDISTTFFDIKPYPYQKEILEELKTQRVTHNRYKNLLVAATGTGKTIISAFDYKNFKNSNNSARLLFVAHRKEILIQAMYTFRAILRDNNFGELWVDGIVPTSNEFLFVSVQTLRNRINDLTLNKDYYDFIIVDEVHHIAASSYRPILRKFSPKILLGLTATPERMDNENILNDFCGVIAAEIRLPEALNRKLLTPFQYFGISDSIDLTNVKWQNGKYSPTDLTKVYSSKIRVGEIIEKCRNYLTDFEDVRALGFCVTQEHAKYMSDKFNESGLRAQYLISNNKDKKIREIKEKLRNKEINYLFVVDIFNEGVDIPEIDTVLFLRPTESLTIFLQQLGRGLRLSDNKDFLTVLDFVGNAREEYDFNGKFRALIGKTNSSTESEIENNFPHLPLGCSIILEKKAKEYILNNINKAMKLSKKRLINKITNYRHQTTLPLNINNFTKINNIPLEKIYKKDSWSNLCYQAGVLKEFENKNEKELVRAITKKWLLSRSLSYFKFILKLIETNFEISNFKSENDKLLLTMLYYDFWQDENLFDSLEIGIKAIGENKILIDELEEVVKILINRINYIEKDIELPYQQPLKLYSRYTREQILSAFGKNRFEKKGSSREGVLNIKEKNTELLFVTLEKTEDKYSPTTMYNDYAINEKLFHWQSQNSTRPDSPKGVSYIKHEELNKNILLFVRESNSDKFKNVMTYIFLGKLFYKSHTGSQPMSIIWELEEKIPHFLRKVIIKMATG